MYKLNFIQYPSVNELLLNETFSFQALKDNSLIESKVADLKKRFGFESLNNFLMIQDGILSLMLKLKGKILVSKGESQAIIDGAMAFKNLGFDIEFISLTKEGFLNYDEIQRCDYFFVSSYIMDTFVNVDLKRVKTLSNAVIISNISATIDSSNCDMAILDSYKLTGFASSSILLHNNFFEELPFGQLDTLSLFLIGDVIEKFKTNNYCKEKFQLALNDEFKNDIYYFVNPIDTLSYTLHFGLKDIKAREIIRTLALSNIFVTNGEGCSLGLSKPSRIIQEMGYKEIESRWSLSLSFTKKLEDEEINFIVKTISKKYKQIKRLNQYE